MKTFFFLRNILRISYAKYWEKRALFYALLISNRLRSGGKFWILIAFFQNVCFLIVDLFLRNAIMNIVCIVPQPCLFWFPHLVFVCVLFHPSTILVCLCKWVKSGCMGWSPHSLCGSVSHSVSSCLCVFVYYCLYNPVGTYNYL